MKILQFIGITFLLFYATWILGLLVAVGFSRKKYDAPLDPKYERQIDKILKEAKRSGIDV